MPQAKTLCLEQPGREDTCVDRTTSQIVAYFRRCLHNVGNIVQSCILGILRLLCNATQQVAVQLLFVLSGNATKSLDHESVMEPRSVGRGSGRDGSCESSSRTKFAWANHTCDVRLGPSRVPLGAAGRIPRHRATRTSHGNQHGTKGLEGGGAIVRAKHSSHSKRLAG